MKNPIHALEQRFAYQFKDNIGIDIARGWADGFVKLCEAIDAETASDPTGQHYGFHWRQVKEKFGTARLYYRMDGTRPTLRVDAIDAGGNVTPLYRSSEPDRSSGATPQGTVAALIEAAELWMQRVCIVCGRTPAALDKTGGCILNLCEHHAQQRNADRNSLESPGFED